MNRILNSMLAVAASLLLMFSMSAVAQTSGGSSSSGASTGSSDQSSMGSSSQSSQSSDTSTQKSNTTMTGKSGGGADQQFAIKAAEGGKSEVELGQLAQQKASNDDVKKFGQRMIDDHTKAGQQLQSAASGMTLPDQPNPKQQAEKDRLSKLSGAAFDKAYMNYEVKDHEKDVADFQKEAKNGKDQNIKSFASSTLPTLEDHLKQAKQVDLEVKGTSKSASAASDNSSATSQSASNSKKNKSYLTS